VGNQEREIQLAILPGMFIMWGFKQKLELIDIIRETGDKHLLCLGKTE
jgi:hypothetical protein